MPKRTINKLRWKAQLMNIDNIVDEDDRVQTERDLIRDIFYEDKGITAEEKYLSRQSKTDVVRRIKCRKDMSITEKDNGIRINDIDYNIVRIYINSDNRTMELSLSYVD